MSECNLHSWHSTNPDATCPACGKHAERLDALEAENERLRQSEQTLANRVREEWEKVERLRAELATARNDAAEVCEKLAQEIYDEYDSTDPETGERMIPTRCMDTVEAYEECAEAIRALKREGGV